jgi:mercuric ion binding protein
MLYTGNTTSCIDPLESLMSLMNKRVILLIVPLLLLLAVNVAHADQKVVMEIKGMTCVLCPLAIKKSLSGIKGVGDVKISYEEKKAWLTIDETVTDTTLVEAVQKAGPLFSGKVVERTP